MKQNKECTNPIYYCEICAMSYRLPLRIGEMAAGYCRICGYAGGFCGSITPEEAEGRGIEIKTLEELGTQ